jgi:hypothetical protein
MTPAEIKKQTLARIAQRSDALHKEWCNDYLNPNSTEQSRFKLLVEIQKAANEYFWVKKMSPEQVAKIAAQNAA